ncbi:MAG: hypothetical protein PHE27_00905 [Alphaproteobacteria bacterium]|nr:hypothetical protein [Alphaproteobacteria bacterium]
MKYISYRELVKLFGRNLAGELLRVLERASLHINNVIPFNRDERMKRALESLNEESIEIAGDDSPVPPNLRRKSGTTDRYSDTSAP